VNGLGSHNGIHLSIQSIEDGVCFFILLHKEDAESHDGLDFVSSVTKEVIDGAKELAIRGNVLAYVVSQLVGYLIVGQGDITSDG
jgi:hypothetical protein